jgi:hypothetical protein
MTPCIYVIDGDINTIDMYMQSKHNPLLLNVHDMPLDEIFEYINNKLSEEKQKMIIIHRIDHLLPGMSETIATNIYTFLEAIPDLLSVLIIINKTIYSDGWNILKNTIDPPQTPRWLTGEE